MSVVGTMIVPFGESAVGAGGGIIAEWDDTMNVVVAGTILGRFTIGAKLYFVVITGTKIDIVEGKDVKPNFYPGDQVYLLLHADPSLVRIVDVKATSGTISAVGQAVLSRSEELGFASADEVQELHYLPADSPAFSWFGNVGRLPVQLGRQVQLSSGVFPCLAKVSYSVGFSRYLLRTPQLSLEKDDTFPIQVYVYYEEIEA